MTSVHDRVHLLSVQGTVSMMIHSFLSLLYLSFQCLVWRGTSGRLSVGELPRNYCLTRSLQLLQPRMAESASENVKGY